MKIIKLLFLIIITIIMFISFIGFNIALFFAGWALFGFDYYWVIFLITYSILLLITIYIQKYKLF